MNCEVTLFIRHSVSCPQCIGLPYLHGQCWQFAFFGIRQKVMHQPVRHKVRLFLPLIIYLPLTYTFHQESRLPFRRCEPATYLTRIITSDISWLTPFAPGPVMKWFGWKYVTLDWTPVWALHTPASRKSSNSPRLKGPGQRSQLSELRWWRMCFVINAIKGIKVIRATAIASKMFCELVHEKETLSQN